jgi:hypothetical protein
MRMCKKYYFLFFILLLCSGLPAQQPGTGTVADGKNAVKPIRIVDTLTAAEKAGRNPVILQRELDSLILQYTTSHPPPVIREPVQEISDRSSPYLWAGLTIIIALLVFIVVLLYRHRDKINRVLTGSQEKESMKETGRGNEQLVVTKDKKGKTTTPVLETKIRDLNAELHKLSKENEGLNRVIKEYNGIQHEYDSLKHGILKAYKVRNYPGYDGSKNESMAMQGVLQTENAVAAYAYEKFLKPILALTDANKNNPAKISAADQDKLLDLLVSLSLLYIEYLYLRVNELSVGGRMVERIQGLSKGNGLDAALLKKLNTDFGSRALVIPAPAFSAGVRVDQCGLFFFFILECPCPVITPDIQQSRSSFYPA